MIRRRLGQVLATERGAALVEFALIAPVLVMMLLGLFEVGYNLYIRTQLQGAVQQSARSSSIEAAFDREAGIDAAVTAAVRKIHKDADVSFDRQSYATFSDVAQPEDFDDVNNDGICNDGERFEDANGNGMWDPDRGKTGFGGARDVVLYTVSISYPRAFGVAQLLNFGDTVEFDATTVLRNQPYDSQTVYAVAGNCT